MKRSALVAAALLVVACVSTNVALLDTSVHYVPTCKEGVQFYSTKDKAPEKYKEVAILSSSGSSGFTNQSQMIESMRDEAAKIGATGVILNEIAEPGAGAKVAGAIFGVSPERQGRAVAIFAEADTMRVRQACSPLSPKSAATENVSSPTQASAAPAPGTTAAVCIARDTVTRSGGQAHVVLHEEQQGHGCVEFRRCQYEASVVLDDAAALAQCRGEVKKEE